MIIRLFVAVVIILALSYAYQQFRKLGPGKRKQSGIKLALYLTAGVILLLIATGRVHWITALFAGIVPFLSRLIPLAIRVLPFISQLKKQRMAGRMNWGDTSTLQSRFLKLQLDQDSGRIMGEVLAGLYAGKTLSELSAEEVNQLADYYRQEDPESLRLLQAFLQQTRGGSEERYEGNPRGGMSRSEALAVLGLEGEPSEGDIIGSHKKLMQRLHPDRGGSTYLAAKVNQAKDVLLGR